MEVIRFYFVLENLPITMCVQFSIGNEKILQKTLLTLLLVRKNKKFKNQPFYFYSTQNLKPIIYLIIILVEKQYKK